MNHPGRALQKNKSKKITRLSLKWPETIDPAVFSQAQDTQRSLDCNGDSALYMARDSERGCTGEIVHLAENEKFAPIYTNFHAVSSFQKRQG